ncbi:MAG: ABC transporter ATP-binding protein [Selenomonadaceae bacterium]|nr:ABC transporter ATP-binding protein [Selenomonadaceae bacterium]
MKNILSVKNLSVSYGYSKIVEDINFDLERGEILAIVGESGSGKSTILNAIGGILNKNFKISSGKIFFNDQDITNINQNERRKLAGESIAMIFQNSGASFCPIRTIGDQIFESVLAHKNCTHEEFFSKAVEIMKSINLDESVLNKYPFELSGGMSQRVGILAAMILKPQLLLADEPTSALDTVTQFNVVNELLKLRDQFKISIVIVTHNLNLAKYISDKIFVMSEEFNEQNFRSQAS